MAQCWTPARTISSRSAQSSGASGVVKPVERCWPPTRTPSVPSRPTFSPAASTTDDTRSAVVVLPLVPVTPMSLRCRSGWS